MAKALTITVDTEFDSSLPLSLHSLGVPGYINRYVADTLPESTGASVNLWADQLGTLALAAPSAERRPTVGASAGRKFLSFDGTSQGLSGNFTAGKIKTVAMVVRNHAPAGSQGYFMFSGDVIISQHVNNNAAMFVTGGAPQMNTPSNSFPSGKWGVVIAVVDGANSVIRANGMASALGGEKATGVLSRFTLGREGNVYGKLDIAEMVAWPTALSASQCAAVLTSLTREHAAILSL